MEGDFPTLHDFFSFSSILTPVLIVLFLVIMPLPHQDHKCHPYLEFFVRSGFHNEKQFPQWAGIRSDVSFLEKSVPKQEENSIFPPAISVTSNIIFIASHNRNQV